MISFWFQKSFNLHNSGLWRGMTEVHSHLLPGVDDGVETNDEALSLLRFMEKEVGVERACFTPHTMMDFNNAPALRLQEKFQKFVSFYSGGIQLSLASEYMLDSSFQHHLSEGVLSLGAWNHRKLLLVEGARMNLLPGFYEKLETCFQAGYTPVIAHPERYIYMDEGDFQKLRERGCLFQLNIPSLHGYYGKQVQQIAYCLLNKEMYDFAAFDIHRYTGYARVIKQLSLPRKRLDQLCFLLENNKMIQFHGNDEIVE